MEILKKKTRKFLLAGAVLLLCCTAVFIGCGGNSPTSKSPTIYNITYAAVDGTGASIIKGDITLDGIFSDTAPTVVEGDSVSFSITEPDGYTLADVYVGNTKLTATDSVYSYKPTDNVTITARFTVESDEVHTVTYNAVDENKDPVLEDGIFIAYTGTGQAPIQVANGGDLAFRVVTPSGYNLVSVSDDDGVIDVVAGSGNTYVVQQVTADVTITASFAKIAYLNITYQAFKDTTEVTNATDLNAIFQSATTTGPAPATVAYEGSFSFKMIIPTDGDGWNFVSIKNGADDITPDTYGNYNVANVTDNVIITVVFTEKLRKDITVASDHGVVSVFDDYDGHYSTSRGEVGQNIFFWITPDIGWLIDSITVTGDDTGDVVPLVEGFDNPWEASPLPNEDITITVVYDPVPDYSNGNPFVIMIDNYKTDPRIAAGALQLPGVELRVFLTGPSYGWDNLPGNGGQVVPVSGAGYDFTHGVKGGDRDNPPWPLDIAGYPYNNIGSFSAWGGSSYVACAFLLPGWDTWPATEPPAGFDPNDMSTWGIESEPTVSNPYIIPVSDYTDNALIAGGALQLPGVKLRVYINGDSWVYDNLANKPQDVGQIKGYNDDPDNDNTQKFSMATSALFGVGNYPWAMDFDFPYTHIESVEVWNGNLDSVAIVLPGWDTWTPGDLPPTGFDQNNRSTWVVAPIPTKTVMYVTQGEGTPEMATKAPIHFDANTTYEMEVQYKSNHNAWDSIAAIFSNEQDNAWPDDNYVFSNIEAISGPGPGGGGIGDYYSTYSFGGSFDWVTQIYRFTTNDDPADLYMHIELWGEATFVNYIGIRVVSGDAATGNNLLPDGAFLSPSITLDVYNNGNGSFVDTGDEGCWWYRNITNVPTPPAWAEQN